MRNVDPYTEVRTGERSRIRHAVDRVRADQLSAGDVVMFDGLSMEVEGTVSDGELVDLIGPRSTVVRMPVSRMVNRLGVVATVAVEKLARPATSFIGTGVPA